MAQSGYTPISLYYSSTTGAVPTAGQLVNGELAVNITDGKAYYKSTTGAVNLLASSSGASGDVVGPSGATANAVALFDGTTGKLIKSSTSLLPTGAIVGTTDTQTLSNKFVVSRVTGVASASTITPNSDTTDQYEVTALATGLTVNAPSGTPTDGQKLIIRILDNGTSQTITWTTSSTGYRVVGSVLPTTTVPNKVSYIGCIWNSQASYWDAVAVANET